jgi:hypothetical protein
VVNMHRKLVVNFTGFSKLIEDITKSDKYDYYHNMIKTIKFKISTLPRKTK